MRAATIWNLYLNHSTKPNELLSAALRHAQRGELVFPLHHIASGTCNCRKAECGSAGKHPRTSHGLNDATTDPDVIRRWWAKWPTANVGVRTGPESGLWMVGPDGPTGIADLEALQAKNGRLPRTATVRSGSGGKHYYFRYPADSVKITNRKNHRGTRIDVRGDGGYAVTAPSVNANGAYVWEDECEPAEAPAWLLAWARGVDKTDRTPDAPPPQPDASAAVVERASKYLARVPAAVSGQGGHDRTFAAARAMVYGFDLPREVALGLLLVDYNPRCEPPWEEKDLRHKVEDADTKPSDKPRGWLRDGPTAEQASSSPSARELSTERPWPAALADEAFIGPLGDYVRAIEADTESDPSAVMVQLLLMFGSAVGRGPRFDVGMTAHHANESVVVVGGTSSGRKGTSFGDARCAFAGVDDAWLEHRVVSGLSSGEGLIYFVRDPVEQRQPVKKQGRVVDYETVVVDGGEPDKRAFVVESEFVSVLRQAERTGNILSVVIRQAWETGCLRTLVKTCPTKATGAHVSIVGHITEPELKKYLSEVETANGFGNRFLWFVSRRARFLAEPRTPDPQRTATIRARILAALQKGKGQGELRRDAEAQAVWREVYEVLERDRPGLAGSLLARAAPHVIRLSLIYALSEGANAVGARHLKAALAIWEYAERSVDYLFGDNLGDAVAEATLMFVRGCPQGITRTDITRYHGNNLSASRLSAVLGLLQKHGRLRCEIRPTGGRPAEVWFPIGGRHE